MTLLVFLFSIVKANCLSKLLEFFKFCFIFILRISCFFLGEKNNNLKEKTQIFFILSYYSLFPFPVIHLICCHPTRQEQ